jgi:uncharacterized membrane protein YgcG
LLAILMLLSVASWFRYRFLSGSLLRNLTSLGLFVGSGAILGLFVGSAIGAIEVDLNPGLSVIETIVRPFVDIFASGRVLSALANFNRTTLVGVTSGALSGGVLWFFRDGSGYRGHAFGGGSGGSSGGGASGSW